MALLTHFLPNCVFILVFTVFASIVSGFWPFLFKPPLKKIELVTAEGEHAAKQRRFLAPYLAILSHKGQVEVVGR